MRNNPGAPPARYGTVEVEAKEDHATNSRTLGRNLPESWRKALVWAHLLALNGISIGGPQLGRPRGWRGPPRRLAAGQGLAGAHHARRFAAAPPRPAAPQALPLSMPKTPTT